jgi:hypothetical protein
MAEKLKKLRIGKKKKYPFHQPIRRQHSNIRCDYEQIYHVWEGFLWKIPIERRKISRAEWRVKFSLETGIFRKYPSQT